MELIIDLSKGVRGSALVFSLLTLWNVLKDLVEDLWGVNGKLFDLEGIVMLDLLCVIVGVRGGKGAFLISFARLRDFVGVVNRKED